MPPFGYETFERRVQGLDGDAFGRFVADLWARRGWETRYDGETIVATRQAPSRDRRVLSLGSSGARASGPSATADPSGEYDVVITRFHRPSTEQEAGHVVNVDDLYEIALYGIDRAALDDLCRRHFGVSTAAMGGGRMAMRVGRWTRSLATRFTSETTLKGAGIVLIVAAVVIASGSAVVLDESAAGDGIDGGNPVGATPVPTSTARPTPVPVRMESASAMPECAPPPVDRPPADLRPGVIPYPSPWGLEGWTIRSERTVSSFPGPNALPTPGVPEEQYVGTYLSPRNVHYRLEISRWTSPEQADRIGAAMADDWPYWIAWGAYTITVSAFSTEGSAITSPPIDVNARHLMAEIGSPDGAKIGGRCLDALRRQ